MKIMTKNRKSGSESDFGSKEAEVISEVRKRK
jgi:hypothetical protein